MISDGYFKETYMLSHYAALLVSDPRERSPHLSHLMTLTQPCKCHQRLWCVTETSVSRTQEIHLCQIPLNGISHFCIFK